MYAAELNGKISSKMKRKEDILTSNVFSFFKYSDRNIFLKAFFNQIGLSFTDTEIQKAEFIFWPTLSENTEPDLVIIVGDYYLLIEAKYHSNFGKAIGQRKSQLHRELKEGRLEANNLDKTFKLIAITADYYFKPYKFQRLKNENCFIWINWQSIATLIFNILDDNVEFKKHELVFANDLYDLLVKKNLREYRGKQSLIINKHIHKNSGSLFFEARTAKYRGGFIGFKDSLIGMKDEMKSPNFIFFSQRYDYFSSLTKLDDINQIDKDIYLKGGKY